MVTGMVAKASKTVFTLVGDEARKFRMVTQFGVDFRSGHLVVNEIHEASEHNKDAKETEESEADGSATE